MSTSIQVLYKHIKQRKLNIQEQNAIAQALNEAIKNLEKFPHLSKPLVDQLAKVEEMKASLVLDLEYSIAKANKLQKTKLDTLIKETKDLLGSGVGIAVAIANVMISQRNKGLSENTCYKYTNLLSKHFEVDL